MKKCTIVSVSEIHHHHQYLLSPLCPPLPAPVPQGVWPLTAMSSYRVACWQLERIRSGLVPWIPQFTSSTHRQGKVRPGKVVVFSPRQFFPLVADVSLQGLSTVVLQLLTIDHFWWGVFFNLHPLWPILNWASVWELNFRIFSVTLF